MGTKNTKGSIKFKKLGAIFLLEAPIFLIFLNF